MRQRVDPIASFALGALSALLLTGCGDASAPTPTPTATPTPTPTPAAPADGCITPPTGLVAWWPADGDARDVVAGRDGSLVGSTGFSQGVVREAFHFPNSGKTEPDYVGTDWVSVPDAAAWDLGDRSFTIEMWVSFASVFSQGPHQQPLIGNTEGPGATNKWILWLENDSLTFHINGRQTGGANPVTSAWHPATGEWHHVAVTRDGSTWSLFIDGLQTAAGTAPITIPDADADLTIGRAESTWLEGDLDEVSLYDRALSPEEIASLSAATAGKCTP